MLSIDIDLLKQKLYNAIDEDDYNTAYSISTELDVLIVEFYRSNYCYNMF